MEELAKCANIESKGIQDLKDLWPMPVFEMTREPRCDKRKTEKEAD